MLIHVLWNYAMFCYGVAVASSAFYFLCGDDWSDVTWAEVAKAGFAVAFAPITVPVLTLFVLAVSKIDFGRSTRN